MHLTFSNVIKLLNHLICTCLSYTVEDVLLQVTLNY